MAPALENVMLNKAGIWQDEGYIFWQGRERIRAYQRGLSSLNFLRRVDQNREGRKSPIIPNPVQIPRRVLRPIRVLPTMVMVWSRIEFQKSR